MRRRAALVAEDRVLAVLPGLGMAHVAAVEIAGKLEPPVPASGRLQQVSAQRAHRAQLRRRSERARFAQDLRDLRIDFELGQGRTRSDPRSLDLARDDVPELDQLFGAHDPVAEQRHELRSARERYGAVAERRSSGLGRLRPEQLQLAPALADARLPRAGRAASLRA